MIITPLPIIQNPEIMTCTNADIIQKMCSSSVSDFSKTTCEFAARKMINCAQDFNASIIILCGIVIFTIAFVVFCVWVAERRP